MIISDFFKFIVSHTDYPWVVFVIIPLFFVLWFIIKKKFVRFDEAISSRKRPLQFWLLWSRTLVFLFLLVAVASPYAMMQTTIKGDPFVKVLVDNSTSFSLFDTSKVNRIKKQLEKEIGVQVAFAGTAYSSAIGDAVLDNMKENENLLLITDGNNNVGSDLGDVALYANRLNATINSLLLSPDKNDASVKVFGPSKTVAGIDNQFRIEVDKVGKLTEVKVVVTVDGETVLDETTGESVLTFSKQLTDGYHEIVANIRTKDHFSQNNVFYKTVKVVPKPNILFLTEKSSPLVQLLKQLYNVTVANSLNKDLSAYSAVLVNDFAVKKLNDKVTDLTSYISEGNGLVVVGGKNSYDLGNYKDSRFETLLPVYVATPGKSKGDQNIVVVVDVSGSTSQTTYKDYKGIDVQKAIALDIIKDLKFDNKLAVVAFNTNAYEIDSMSYVSEKTDLEETVRTLTNGGGTLAETAFIMANQILRNTKGNKNIIFISDGVTQRITPALEAAKNAGANGIKIYTVGVGKTTNEDFMKKAAFYGTGIYFKITQAEKIKILFGDEDDDTGGKDFGVVLLNENHFITRGLDVPATIKGYNTITPKSSANLLITTSGADPLLTVWRFGLGRVAALSTDDGSVWAGSLLSRDSSKLISRTINYAVGDPDRNNKNFVDISDTHLNQSTVLTVRSEKMPVSAGMTFYKKSEDMFESAITPSSLGFQDILGAKFAVNYNVEFGDVGMNKELKNIVESTNGRTFVEDQVDEIIETIKANSVRTINKKRYVQWPFILIALFIFLLEVAYRTIARNKELSQMR